MPLSQYGIPSTNAEEPVRSRVTGSLTPYEYAFLFPLFWRACLPVFSLCTSLSSLYSTSLSSLSYESLLSLVRLSLLSPYVSLLSLLYVSTYVRTFISDTAVNRGGTQPRTRPLDYNNICFAPQPCGRVGLVCACAFLEYIYLCIPCRYPHNGTNLH